MRAWSLKNKGVAAEIKRRWAASNKSKVTESKLRWKQDNPEKRRSSARDYTTRKSKDSGWMLSRRMHSLLGKALKDNHIKLSGKTRNWESWVGYSVKELERHLEINFLPGMSWKNRNLWAIDHIVPQCVWSYDSPDHPEFKACWSLSNLRPLWSLDNSRKRGRLPEVSELYINALDKQSVTA
jgi:hypothetical protein